jgi:hypothetical protein
MGFYMPSDGTSNDRRQIEGGSHSVGNFDRSDIQASLGYPKYCFLDLFLKHFLKRFLGKGKGSSKTP